MTAVSQSHKQMHVEYVPKYLRTPANTETGKYLMRRVEEDLPLKVQINLCINIHLQKPSYKQNCEHSVGTFQTPLVLSFFFYVQTNTLTV